MKNDKPLSRSDLKKEMKNIDKQNKSLLFLYTKVSKLTNSELYTLYLLCQKKSPNEIAKIRNVTPSTIRSIIGHILEKLNYKSYKDLVKHINDSFLLNMMKDWFSENLPS